MCQSTPANVLRRKAICQSKAMRLGQEQIAFKRSSTGMRAPAHPPLIRPCETLRGGGVCVWYLI